MSQETCRFAGTEPEGSDHEGLIVLFTGSPHGGSVCDAFFPVGKGAFFIAIHAPFYLKGCMKMKRKLAVIMSIAMLAAMTGCGQTAAPADSQEEESSVTETTAPAETEPEAETTAPEESSEEESEPEEEDEENYETGDASLDNFYL